MATNLYVNLYKTRTYMGLASADSADDADILGFIREASRAVDKWTRRKFYPERKERSYNYKDIQSVALDEDLLELESLRTQNGACAVATTILLLARGENYNVGPYDHIAINSSSGSVLNYSGTIQKANVVLGKWGYNENWASAWRDTGASLIRDTGSNASLLNINGGSTGSGTSDIEYEYPRIGIGDLLQVGDEYFHVVGAGSENTLVNVRPAANGTTTASHASGTSITRFVPEDDIMWSTRHLAAWSYSLKDAPFTTRMAFPALGQISIVDAWPEPVKERLKRYRRDRTAYI